MYSSMEGSRSSEPEMRSKSSQCISRLNFSDSCLVRLDSV